MTKTPSYFEAWLEWMRDYVNAAERFVREDSIPVETDEQRELISVKLALFARAMTLFQGTLLLAVNDRQLDLRVHSRGVIEAAMHLIALDREPAFINKLKDDDYRGRRARAKLHLGAMDLQLDITKELADFVSQGDEGAKYIEIGKMVEGTEFDRLYRTYRHISADAAHVTLSSLNRHYVENTEHQTAHLIVHPELDGFEMRQTLSELCISMIIATLMIMKIKEKTDLWEEFRVLTARYRELTSADEKWRAAAP